MNRVIALLFFMLPVIAGAAERGMKVSDLSLGRCELREVIARKQFESTDRAAAIAEQTLPLLKELEVINSKGTVPNKPIKDQLSADDIGKFAELSQRLKSAQISQLMESRRERDLKVMERMVMIADRDYRWQEQPEEKDPDFIIYSAIQLLRFTVKDVNINAPTSSMCTLEYALHSLETEAIDKLNSGNAQLETAIKQFRSILAKYGMEKLDRSRLSKKELETVNDLMNGVIRPMQRHGDFIKDIENIKLMARASDITYESNKQDIAFSGGDISAIGATIQRRNKNNEFTENMQIALGLWIKINEKIPADIVNEWGNLKQ
ncbi:hypothetical protein WNY58_14220 [Neptuniibacter pectenicola]|uniref:Uncharacterized protein n=1 Tax=Neptuniibacter pectenicola TaxID=1806669 RepID=A0ABU9TVS5_9GAMM